MYVHFFFFCFLSLRVTHNNNNSKNNVILRGTLEPLQAELVEHNVYA